jgi:hypothetical protein
MTVKVQLQEKYLVVGLEGLGVKTNWMMVTASRKVTVILSPNK